MWSHEQVSLQSAFKVWSPRHQRLLVRRWCKLTSGYQVKLNMLRKHNCPVRGHASVFNGGEGMHDRPV